MENNGGTYVRLGDMKDLVSQQIHRYAPLWTDRYRGRTIAHSCNNEIQFHGGHPSTKRKTASASSFALEEMAIQRYVMINA